MNEYTALIVAAGAGTRMGLGYNKAYYRMADGKTILEHTMDCFLQDEDCKEIVVVTDSEDFYHALGPDTIGKIVVVQGGASREESVWNGMKAVLCDTVFVHDGARPFLPKECLNAMKLVMEQEEAACLMVPCKDTVQRVEDGYIAEALPRESLMAAQTPQAFRTDLIINCLEQAERDGYTGTDDCSAVLRYTDVRIKAVTGSYANIKITTPEDLKEFR